MRKSLSILAIVAAVSGTTAAVALAEQYGGPGFSGSVWMAERGAKVERLGTIHVGEPGFVMNLESQGQRISSLFKWESEMVWSVMHDQKMYMEIPPEKSGWRPYEAKACFGFEDGEKVGSETVNGRSTEKWRCTGQTMMSQGEQPSDATIWWDPELEFGVRSVDDDGNTFEVRDIEVGAQDSSMFEIPPEYRKFDMNAMMQQMMQQGQQ